MDSDTVLDVGLDSGIVLEWHLYMDLATCPSMLGSGLGYSVFGLFLKCFLEDKKLC